MKQSIYTKELKVIGTQRGVTGKIAITINARLSTGTHKVEGFMENSVLFVSDLLRSEDQVIEAVKSCERHLLEKMKEAGDAVNDESFISQLRDMGFNI